VGNRLAALAIEPVVRGAHPEQQHPPVLGELVEHLEPILGLDARPAAAAAGTAELVGGLLFATGPLTPLAAALIIP
jgi:uncharacterized membrane protein YphA (DoxX/SURF4 family)